MKMPKQKGFSLIELLIVVAIILIIAAIAIPNLLRAKISANESSAVGSVRSMITAEISYSTSFPQTGYAANLLALGPGAGNQTCPAGGPAVANACLIDAVLAAGTKSGYGFESLGQSPVNGANTSFTTGAVPITYNQTGTRNSARLKTAFCARILRRLVTPAGACRGGSSCWRRSCNLHRGSLDRACNS